MQKDEELRIPEEARSMNRKPEGWGRLVYVVLVFCICLAPFAGMLWTGGGTTAETSSTEPVPSIVDSAGNPDIEFARKLSEYFESHFAYRSLAIDAYAHLRADIFATSPTSQVVVGTDGWLYYGGTLDDYLASDPLTEREVDNIVHNLTLMQGYTEAMGSTFIFTVAPNKNSLYPDHMPYHLTSGDNDDMTLLVQRLNAAGIGFLDLFAKFEAEKDVLYYKTDSHWNYEGALMVSDALLDLADRDPVNVVSTVMDDTFVGDIERMLYPTSASPESSLKIDVAGNWSYTNEAISVEDATVRTEGGGEGSLLMYRDSFANNLIPLLSPSFATCHYTKLIPYDITLIARETPDVVIIERAQRHVGLLADDPPIMPAPMVTLDEKTISAGDDSVFLVSGRDGDFVVIEGRFDSNVIGGVEDIYLELDSGDADLYFVPFRLNPAEEVSLGDEADSSEAGDEDSDPTSSDTLQMPLPSHEDSFGFKAYVPASVFEQRGSSLNVLVRPSEGESIYRVGGILTSP
ncbi:MAG TPA: hypothetical protein DEB24_04450 [Coriobacteriia bacterium]|nr:hypothetical protein [Coriobacteriia bacterium]